MLYKYLLFACIAVISVLLTGAASARYGVIDAGKSLKIYKSCDVENIVPYKGKFLIISAMLCIIISFALQVSLYINTSVINFIKLYGLFVIVLTAAVIDSKRKIIPNLLIIAGLCFRVAIYIYEIISSDSIAEILKNDLIGFAIGFVFLAIVSVITKGSLGFGDAKLFGIIGITSGSYCTYSTLLVSLIISSVISIALIISKKMGRKDSFPFGPSIALGYIIVILLGSY